MVLLIGFNSVFTEPCFQDLKYVINSKETGIKACVSSSHFGKTILSYAFPKYAAKLLVDGIAQQKIFTLNGKGKQQLQVSTEFRKVPEDLTYTGHTMSPQKGFYYLLEISPDKTVEINVGKSEQPFTYQQIFLTYIA